MLIIACISMNIYRSKSVIKCKKDIGHLNKIIFLFLLLLLCWLIIFISVGQVVINVSELLIVVVHLILTNRFFIPKNVCPLT